MGKNLKLKECGEEVLRRKYLGGNYRGNRPNREEEKEVFPEITKDLSLERRGGGRGKNVTREGGGAYDFGDCETCINGSKAMISKEEGGEVSREGKKL